MEVAQGDEGVCDMVGWGVVIGEVDEEEKEDGGMGQFNRSKAMVPRMLTNRLDLYFRAGSICSASRAGSSSKTPEAATNSVIWPSLRKAVRMLGRVNAVPLASFPGVPGPDERMDMRLLRNGSIILDGRPVPGPTP